MKYVLFITAMIFSQFSIASGFHYCTGKITNIVTRASSAEGTQITLEGMTGYSQIGYGGNTLSSMHQRQFSMILSAAMTGKAVTLEFENDALTCASNHDGVLIRYVNLAY